MSRESCCSTRLAFSLSVLRSLLMGAQITHPQLELGNQQDSFESTSLSCFSPSFSLFLLSNCELDYDSLYCLLAAASICNLSSVKIFACNSRHLWIAPQLFIWLFGFIAILHEKKYDIFCMFPCMEIIHFQICLLSFEQIVIVWNCSEASEAN